ncbi:MAG: hypothetical protein U9R74_00070 [Pseudomonadota bacterium]|nr:hypothetical protein [Pseudomonadota bacterium]
MSARISGLLGRTPGSATVQAPHDLLDGIARFLEIAERAEDANGGELDREDIGQLGEYGLDLISNLDAQLQAGGGETFRTSLRPVTLSITGWIVRGGGTVQALEPVVNALAEEANRHAEPRTLRQIEALMTSVLDACPDFVRNDLEQLNPARPWRVLHLNRCITATRTREPEIMERVFDDFIQTLPDEAPGFFTEGMSEMDRVGYPPRVRQVMQRYYDRFARNQMN